MSNVLIGYSNKADGATLAGGSYSAALVLNNLKDGNLSKVARTSNAAITSTRFRFDLAANYALRALALARHNLSTAATWRLRLGTAPLDIDFTKETSDDRLTISGGANGTRVNSAGLIVAATAPRFDYDPATLAAKGILIEEAATNLALHNCDGTQAAWVKTSITAAKTATGPDGAANSATTITATGANGTILQTVVSASAARATACLVKRRTGTGTVQMTQDNGATWTTIAPTALWTRVFIPSATVTNPVFGFRLVTSGDAIDFAYFQIESRTFSTSSIGPTAGASVTRSADAVAITGGTFSAFFVAATGTLYADYDIASDSTTGLFPVVASISDNTSNNSAFMYGVTASDIYAGQVNSGGGAVATMTNGLITYGTAAKSALAYAVNDFAFCNSGGTVQTDSAGAVPVTPTRLDIGALAGGTSVLNGHIKRLTYWPSRLTNAQLQSITTSGPDAIGYDSGYVSVKSLTFSGDALTSASWGLEYNALLAFDAVTARYGTVDIIDTANASGYVQAGRLFVGRAFQPTTNADSAGWQDSREDLSSIMQAVNGAEYAVERRRRKRMAFNFIDLTQAEMDVLHEMQSEIGLTDEVVLIPDPADMAYSQRYGGLGLLSELSAFDFPNAGRRPSGFRWKEKL